jgi:hypothetical protein
MQVSIGSVKLIRLNRRCIAGEWELCIGVPRVSIWKMVRIS